MIEGAGLLIDIDCPAAKRRRHLPESVVERNISRFDGKGDPIKRWRAFGPVWKGLQGMEATDGRAESSCRIKGAHRRAP